MDDKELDRVADRLFEKLEDRGTPPRLFDVEEAARYLGRSIRAVRALAARGVIPVTMLDSKPQFDKAALDKLIKDSTHFTV